MVFFWRKKNKNESLLKAIRGGQSTTVQVLLARGADVNARGGYDRTALMWAVKEGRADIINTLLDKGADVNARTSWDETALTIAKEGGRSDIVKLLIDNGADTKLIQNTMPKRPHILIADADEITRTGLTGVLTKCNYNIFTAETGEKALSTQKNIPLDILLADMKLPDMSGTDLLRKAKFIDPFIRVIILTVAGAIDSYLEAMNLGAVECLNKPVDTEELKKVISKVLISKQKTRNIITTS